MLRYWARPCRVPNSAALPFRAASSFSSQLRFASTWSLCGSAAAAPWSRDSTPLADILKGTPTEAKAKNLLDVWDISTGTVADFKKLPYLDVSCFRHTFQESYARIASVGARALNVNQYLASRINNMSDSWDTELQERSGLLNECGVAIRHHEMNPASCKKGILCLWSTRGSGKTQFIKNLLFVDRDLQSRATSGRVLVLDCERLSPSSPFDAAKVMIEMIVKHVADVTEAPLFGFDDPDYPREVEAAYKYWTQTTSRFFMLDAAGDDRMKPVVILDTTEALTSATERVHANGQPYTRLEALGLMVPALHVMMCVGCKASMQPTSLMLARANITYLNPLPAFSDPATFSSALVRSWKVSKVDAAMVPAVFLLAGGLPRALRIATGGREISFVSGSIHAVRDSHKSFVADLTTMYHDVVQRREFYFAALCAAVRWRGGDDTVLPTPLWWQPDGNGRKTTFQSAVEDSLLAAFGKEDPASEWSSKRLYTVTPALMLSDKWRETEKQVRADFEKNLDGHHYVELSSLFPCVQPDFLDQAASNNPRRRGGPWEQMFVHAFFVRYLLARWMRCHAGAKDPDWIPLSAVLPGTTELLVEVNMSDGLNEPTESTTYDSALADVTEAKKRFLTWNHKVNNSHHEAYVAARRVVNGKQEEGVLVLQLRHGDEKSGDEIKLQVRTSKKSGERIQFPLLLCYDEQRGSGKQTLGGADVFSVDGSNICFGSRIYLRTLWNMDKPSSLRQNQTGGEVLVANEK